MSKKQKFDDRLEGAAPAAVLVNAKKKKKKIWVLVRLEILGLVCQKGNIYASWMMMTNFAITK